VPVRPAEPVVRQPTQTIEVLIREARRRQRRRRLIILGALFILAAAGFLAVRITTTSGSPPPARPSSLKGPGHPVVATGQFSGTWHFHTTSVIIQSNGQGSVTWPGPLKPGESEATAVPGHAELRVTRVSGSQAVAVVSGSTERSVLPDGLARLRVTSQDLLYLTPTRPITASPFGGAGLCGPSAAALTVAQQVAANINCGA
jgi:hypothetical protein